VEMGLKSCLFILRINLYSTALIPSLFILVSARQNVLAYIPVLAHYCPYEGLVYFPLCLYIYCSYKVGAHRKIDYINNQQSEVERRRKEYKTKMELQRARKVYYIFEKKAFFKIYTATKP